MSVLHLQLFRSFGKPVTASVISENTCRYFLLSRGFATSIEFRYVGIIIEVYGCLEFATSTEFRYVGIIIEVYGCLEFATSIEFRYVGYNYIGLWMSRVCYKH
ncbi:hypothetical protein RRG08_024785 [Elysia crispata]|uniref:Uncharacterized protein n=1 Tax=Elysia crispata TaxID=231223 RepID=A0AAE0XQD4_9GAST|nr:hypothetical protein RRG08_024785 [Elysia crispata]